MKRCLLLCLALAPLACAAAPPPEPAEDNIFDTSCAGTFDPNALYPGGWRPPTAREGEPPALLDVSLTLGDQPVRHMLPAEQAIGTPVPIYIEPPPGFVFKEARIYTRPFGNRWYRPQKMVKHGDGLAVEVPCTDVSTTGDLRYFIRMLDEDGEVIESLGSRFYPLRVHIKEDLLHGDFPSLPGKKPPRPCRLDDGAPPRRHL